VHFVFYATDGQAQEILAEVSTRGFGAARLFKTTGEDGQPIDGSTVIEQFNIGREQSAKRHRDPSDPALTTGT
jgi:hypothetical protein